MNSLLFDGSEISISVQGIGTLVNQVKKVGEKIVRDIQKTYGKQILLRIDFGCCIDNDSICREYFVNEVECAPAMSDDETKKNNLQSDQFIKMSDIL